MNENSILAGSPNTPDRMGASALERKVSYRKQTSNTQVGDCDSKENVEDHTQDDFLQRIYDNSFLDGACQSVPGMCHGSIEDQLDVFMNCRQPLSMFSLFREHKSVESEGVEVLPLPAGAYVLPTYCEYCKSSHISKCRTHCERPKLYFQKKRPPFARLDPNKWNPQTDFALTKEEQAQDAQRRIDLKKLIHDGDDDDVDNISLASTSVESSWSAPARSKLYFANTGVSSESDERRGQRWLEIWSNSE